MYRQVLIQEKPNQPKRWEVTDKHYGWTRSYATAAYALRAAKRGDRARAERGISTITEIEWVVVTEMGRLVVEALQ